MRTETPFNFDDLTPEEQVGFLRAAQQITDGGNAARDWLWGLEYEKAIAEGNCEERSGELADQACDGGPAA